MCILTQKVIYSAFVKYLRQNGNNEAVHRLFIDLKKAYDSLRREVLYNNLIELGIPMKLVRLIKMCLTAMYSRVWIGKKLSDMFPIRKGLKQGDIRRVQVHQDGLKLNGTNHLTLMLMMLI